MSVMQFAHYVIPFPETIPRPICRKDFLRIGGIELQFVMIEIDNDWRELFKRRNRRSKRMWILLRKVQRPWHPSSLKVHQILPEEMPGILGRHRS